MKILVTGSNGFIGKNLVAQLKNLGFNEIYEFDRESSYEELVQYTQNCDFIFHLAGVNRPQNDDEFITGNLELTKLIINLLISNNNKCPIVISSSIQAELDNKYGISKLLAEKDAIEYAEKYNVVLKIFRLPNVFGKWCRPNYNSVVATFCNNIANNLPISINNSESELNLVYIDDVVENFIESLQCKISVGSYYHNIDKTYNIKLGELAQLIKSFDESRLNFNLINLKNEFNKKLYSTYLSYLPENGFSYKAIENKDGRGSFTELFKMDEYGQISVNVTKSGITKGNHWHNTKVEKFIVVSGTGIIRFRKIGTNDVIEYKVSSECFEIIDIPVGYTHSIENTGISDLVTIMWANEKFNKNNPDTYFLEV